MLDAVPETMEPQTVRPTITQQVFHEFELTLILHCSSSIWASVLGDQIPFFNLERGR